MLGEKCIPLKVCIGKKEDKIGDLNLLQEIRKRNAKWTLSRKMEKIQRKYKVENGQIIETT